ncbi:hypothetical protein BpHYR1_010730 [Brachionus plicatilis]|uniref:Uncharacterized protein n=1 Tax=Brachionus plicatilis TaxID=10195 RepID=A0A3M7SYT8_BRAPC|nr:hypothetical protein BpHYR1_010730 [Brachionus plicatilis]
MFLKRRLRNFSFCRAKNSFVQINTILHSILANGIAGKNNPKPNYILAGTEINTLTSERDLGVIIWSDGNFDDHFSRTVSNANHNWGYF